jgi:hypothetical protein
VNLLYLYQAQTAISQGCAVCSPKTMSMSVIEIYQHLPNIAPGQRHNAWFQITLGNSPAIVDVNQALAEACAVCF